MISVATSASSWSTWLQKSLDVDPSGPGWEPWRIRVRLRYPLSCRQRSAIWRLAIFWRSTRSSEAGRPFFIVRLANATSRSSAVRRLMWRIMVSTSRSWARVVMATLHPSLTLPTTLAAGTRTFSRNTSLNSASPVICRRGRMVMPGVFMPTRRKVMPLCLATVGSVRTRKKPQSATCAMLVHTFWPFSTYQSPSSTARVWRLARSLPALGSEKPWHQSSSAFRILPRCRARCAGVPCFMRVGPSMEIPPRLTGWGASAVLRGPVEADVAGLVEGALPLAQPVHLVAIGARGGEGAAAEVRGHVLFEPSPRFGPEPLLLGGEVEVHGVLLLSDQAGSGLGGDAVDLPLPTLEHQLVVRLDVVAVGPLHLHGHVGVAVGSEGRREDSRRCGLCDLRIAALDHLFEGGPIELLLDSRGSESVGHIEVAATKRLELLHHGLHRLLRRGPTPLRPRRDRKEKEPQRDEPPSSLHVAAILYRSARRAESHADVLNRRMG